MTSWRNRLLTLYRSAQDLYAENIEPKNINRDINHDINRYINRELSWLDFNDRVLALASDENVPLLERCRFVAICSSNLDEFYQIRVAALKDQIAGDISTKTPDGRSPLEQLSEITARTQSFVQRQEDVWTKELLPQLELFDVRVQSWSQLSANEKAELSKDFDQKIFPVLTPLAVDPAHPFPYISNLALNLAVVASDRILASKDLRD